MLNFTRIGTLIGTLVESRYPRSDTSLRGSSSSQPTLSIPTFTRRIPFRRCLQYRIRFCHSLIWTDITPHTHDSDELQYFFVPQTILHRCNFQVHVHNLPFYGTDNGLTLAASDEFYNLNLDDEAELDLQASKNCHGLLKGFQADESNNRSNPLNC